MQLRGRIYCGVYTVSDGLEIFSKITFPGIMCSYACTVYIYV